MKVLLVLVLACVATSLAQEEEPRPAVPRGLLKRGSLTRGKPTTTTTTPPPQDDVEYEDEAEYPAEESQDPSTEAPPSSTEGKKLVGNGVRPFRSNTDLLEALKRRRAQAVEAKLRGHSASEPAANQDSPAEPAKSSFNKKRLNNSPAKDASEEVPPAKPSRGRFGRPATRSVQAEAEEQNDAPAPAPAPAPTRNGRTFARRGN